jgi:subtilisin family serine protease
MPIKVLDASGNGTSANAAAGIIWAVDQGAQVINLSLGGTSPSAVLQSAVDYAYANGVVVVAAAGNSGTNFVLYPARYPHVIAIAATDETNEHAGFSNFGPEVALAAPGAFIYSTKPGGTYGYLSGTSMSAPFVSGLAAILRGIPGIGGPDQIAWEMESTALDLGPAGKDQLFGFGLIQMDAAIRLALPSTPMPTATAIAPSGGFGHSITSPFAAGGYPTPTYTSTALFESSATPSATATSIAIVSGVPMDQGVTAMEYKRLRIDEMLSSKLGSDWPIGCAGGTLIVFGAWQAWRLNRKRVYRDVRRQHFKTR